MRQSHFWSSSKEPLEAGLSSFGSQLGKSLTIRYLATYNLFAHFGLRRALPECRQSHNQANLSRPTLNRRLARYPMR